MSSTTNHIIQQVILLATGAPGSSSVRNDINELYQQTNDWSLVAKLVDEYMNQLTGLNDKGVNGVIQAIANNGFSLQLNDQETQQLVDDLIGRGIDSWSKLFAYIITDVDGALAERLDHRAESANIFTDLLNGLNKDNDYNGSQAVNAAKEWIAGIGVSNESVTAANNSVQDLIARFHEGNVEGTLLDGYVAGATVFIDENGDGVQNAGERSTTSDAQGNFLFEGDLPDGQIVSIGGTDIATGQPFTGVLTAPSGATTVTPFTTLVNNLVKDGLAADIEAAESILFDAFDIPRVDLSTFDPINTALDNNASVENQNIAIKLQSATSQIMNLLNVSSALISQDSAAGSNIQQAVFSSLLDTLINATSNNQTVDLSDEATINTIIQTSASNAGVTRNIETIAAQSAAILSEINSRTQAASDSVSNGEQTTLTALSDIFKLQTLTQTDIVTTISNTQQSGDLTSVVSQFTGTNLTTNVDTVTAGLLNTLTQTNDGSSITNGDVTPTPTPTPAPTDTTAPTLASSTPADDATAVVEGANVVLTFSEAVVAGTGNIVISDGVGDTRTIAVGDATQVTISGNTVTINPAADLSSSTAYYVQLASGVIKDSAGNAYVGISDTISLNFSTTDSVSPTLASSSPADDATAVAVGANVLLNFSEIIAVGTGNIVISDGAGDTRTIAVGDATQVTTMGNTVVINPTADLNANSTYYVQLASGVINDAAGNAYAGITDTTTLNFSTTDTVAPTLASSTPADDATAVAENANVVLTFSETVAAGTGNIVISDGAGDTRTIAVGDATQVTISGSTVTINPTAGLNSNSTYYVQLASGVINDAAGNAYAGISDTTTLNFSTTDSVAPTLASSTPADDATAVVVGANVVLTFSETIAAGTGNIVISDGAGDTRTIAVGDATQVTISGSTVTINPTADLNANSTYYVQLASGVINDATGNAYAGISDTTTLNFSTTDTVAPTLASSTPADDTTAVAIGSNVVLTFSEAVAAGTGNIVISDGAGDTRTIAVGDATQITISGNTVTINPTADLSANTLYYVQLASGVIEDTAGNAYAGISDTTSLNFTTTDTIAPTLASSSPTDDATAVAIGSNVVLTFSEAVAAGTGNIVISDGAGDTRTIAVGDATQVTISGSTVTINPTADLNANSTYYVQLASGVINDAAGNAYAGISDTTSLNFSTPDTLAPTLASSTPADNATAVATSANVVLTFNEAVAAGTGNIVISDGAGDTRTIAVGDATQVTVSGNTVTINPTADLNVSTSYYVQLASGVINDTAGNAYAGISDTTSLNYTTEAVATVTTLTSSADAAGANAYLASGDVTLTIDFASNNYSGADFALGSFGAGDKLRIALADGKVGASRPTDKHANTSIYNQTGAIVGSSQGFDNMAYIVSGTTAKYRFRSATIVYSSTAALSVSTTNFVNTLTITGLPTGLTTTNFEFF